MLSPPPDELLPPEELPPPEELSPPSPPSSPPSLLLSPSLRPLSPTLRPLSPPLLLLPISDEFSVESDSSALGGITGGLASRSIPLFGSKARFPLSLHHEFFQPG